MSFWNVFTEESLQSPWVIGREGEGTAEPTTALVFVVPEGVTSSQQSMMAKMIGALKLKSDQVTIFSTNDDEAHEIQSWSEPKRIMFFGENFPGDSGQAINWFGHQTMKTHSLSDLEAQVELKKETWAHLQAYRSLR